jgi:hypothetical protein
LRELAARLGSVTSHDDAVPVGEVALSSRAVQQFFAQDPARPNLAQRSYILECVVLLAQRARHVIAKARPLTSVMRVVSGNVTNAHPRWCEPS